jgi:hypothetical protein
MNLARHAHPAGIGERLPALWFDGILSCDHREI